ncbi:mitoguardin 2 [Python bivittatus]|uniref:Mitoguardin 2 n=1 Tax=Python bivittatus TaxID=176946 RepID=A0A9F5N0P1_PYTBI|nr:mitoguardin 2 [Python bivittatus]XP_025031355.1 mitoguardin 2 [Python bivittatus]XP_025031356.1 mitoguardin 2 [Python bivittatus]XP_025031357.1 mitoguardin 2 [Python bivittatus]XP_025031358.1 mitoguardin 2 [Python bivittatus]XP_025031359.1 mitoguardin 2 [Python bivittatus]
MAFQRTEGMSIIQALAMTVAEIPVFLYTTFGQSAFSTLRVAPGLRKVLFATALGTVALALAAHQLKRRRRRKKQIAPEKTSAKPMAVPVPILPTRRVPSVKKGYSGRRIQSPSSKSNDTLSGISSIEPSKHSSSSHSLASMAVVNSPSPTPASAGPWEAHLEEDPGAAGDCSAENLYFQGMELFEEALQKWEQALTVRQRDPTGPSLAWDIPKEEELLPEDLCEESQKKEFAEKLELLLYRAYNLQEEFGSTLAADNMLLDLEQTLMFPLTEESLRRQQDDEEDSVTSEESFFSAAEIFDSLEIEKMPFHPSKPAVAYEEALKLVKDGLVLCRTFRTELLGCYSDNDFLAKLHCIRQAFQELLVVENNQSFFGEVGKRMVMGLMTKAEKNTKGFLESYDEMLHYTQRQETWLTTQKELEGRGVVCMNFFDIALDFILMDALEDLENPPSSVLAILRNRWLSDSFKETALATACWSVLKAKRRLLMVPDGFISHFYSVSEHVSPVLAFGFLGPKQHLFEVCSFFKHQILQYLKDMFDLDIVRYTTVSLLAEDILQLSRRRSDILLSYLGVETIPEMNGILWCDTVPIDSVN